MNELTTRLSRNVISTAQSFDVWFKGLNIVLKIFVGFTISIVGLAIAVLGLHLEGPTFARRETIPLLFPIGLTVQLIGTSICAGFWVYAVPKKGHKICRSEE